MATAKYATNISTAKADGYGIITQMIPSMGYHYLNPKVKGFDIRKPVFPKIPTREPVPGAKYGACGAACH